MPRVPEVGHLRFLVEIPADPMPDIFPDDRKAKRLDGRLHRVGNVADPAAGLCRGNSLFKRQFCRVEQALRPV